MYCTKKALLTTMLQNSSRVTSYEETGNAYIKSLQKHTDSELHWCRHLKSKFTSTTSNGKLGVLVEDSEQRRRHPLFRTRYRNTSGATQPSPSPQVTKVSTGVSVCHWFPGNPAMQRLGCGSSASARWLFSDSWDYTRAAAIPTIKQKVPYFCPQHWSEL